MIRDFTDIKLVLRSDQFEEFFDIDLGDNDFEIEEGLDTADLISEFSDRQVSLEEAQLGYRGGWVGCEVMGIDPKTWGSKRWVLYNRRLDKTTLRLWEQYTIDSYKWQIDAGILKSVECEAFVEASNRLGWRTTKTYPDDRSVQSKFSVLWERL